MLFNSNLFTTGLVMTMALLTSSPSFSTAKRLGEDKNNAPKKPRVLATCQDSPLGWHDSDGTEYNCVWYAQGTNCQDFGDSYANHGKTAKQACCACGGGTKGVSSTTPTTPSTTTTTTPNTAVSAKDAWLKAHNDRRRNLHQQHGKTAVDLKWSNSLTANAQKYADFLLERMTSSGTCNLNVMDHNLDPTNNVGGENLAANYGSSTTPENVLQGWWDQELSFMGGHFTQAAWRATKYLGCAEASKDVDGAPCAVQVCRYVKPGNCNGQTMDVVLANDSGCGPACPAEGCF